MPKSDRIRLQHMLDAAWFGAGLESVLQKGVE
jgi:hypothetical protein